MYLLAQVFLFSQLSVVVLESASEAMSWTWTLSMETGLEGLIYDHALFEFAIELYPFYHVGSIVRRHAGLV